MPILNPEPGLDTEELVRAGLLTEEELYGAEKIACAEACCECCEDLADAEETVKEGLSKEAALLPDMPLQPQQQRIVDDAEEGDIRQLLYHGLGSGKTRAAISAAETVGEPYLAITPASLRTNFKNEQAKWTDMGTPSDVKSYTALAKGLPADYDTVIFDEAQRMRNEGSKQTMKAKELAQGASNVLMLSGSPIVNKPTDLAPLIEMLTNKPMSAQQFTDQFIGTHTVNPGLWGWLRGIKPVDVPGMKNEEAFKNLLKGHVDYSPKPDTGVEEEEERYTVPMSSEQERLYKAFWNQLPWVLRWKLQYDYPLTHKEIQRLSSFLAGPRQVSLSTYPFMGNSGDLNKAYTDSPKLMKAVELLNQTLKDPKAKGVIFSNFIEAGLKPYAAALEANKVPHAIFHGGLNDLQRKQIVADYNANKIRALLLAPSGGEGISLKGTSVLQLLDPHWNETRMDQAIGRGIRFDSHSDLPEAQRRIRIQRFFSEPSPGGLLSKLYRWVTRAKPVDERSAHGTDKYLERMSKHKQELNNQFLDVLKEIGTEKEGASAKGIPDRRYFGDLEKLAPGQLHDFIIQRHLAERAGPHFDWRIGNQERKGLYSWATRKPMPGPGGRTLLVQQPMHSYKYKDFEGTIPSGRYGAGRVSKQEEGQVLVTKVAPNAIHFTVAHRKYPERFVMVKPPGWKDKNWLLINKTPTENLPYEKVRYKKIPAEEVEKHIAQMRQGDTMEAKIDGASSLIKLLKDGVEVTSYRQAKETGRPIVYTEKLFHGLPNVNIPPELVGTVLKGELYGQKGKQVIPPQELGGLLNSSVAKSITDQKTRGIQLRNMLFDIQQLGKKHIDWHQTPRLERRKMLDQVLAHLPQNIFHAAPAATTPDEARTLWEQIKSQQHPLTQEGVVYWPLHGPPLKSKLLEDTDVHITGTYPGEGRLANTGIGGFTYALEPGGPTVGRVGTGFSDELRRAAYAGNPDDYIGRVARIRSQQQLPSGAYRAPSLIALHEDYPQAKVGSVLAEPDIGVSVQELEELGIIKDSEEFTIYDELAEELSKDASYIGQAFKAEPIGWQEQRSIWQNITDYLSRIYNRSQQNIDQAYNSQDWADELAPNPMQAKLTRFTNNLQGKDNVLADPADKLIRNYGPSRIGI